MIRSKFAITQLLLEEVLAIIEPFAEKLGSADAIALMEQAEPWLISDLKGLFVGLRSLRKVSVCGRKGFRLRSARTGSGA